MTIIAARTAEEEALLVAWLSARIPWVGSRGFGESQSFAVMRGDDIAAVVVFHDWQPMARTIQLAAAADTPRWASRDVLRALGLYAFVTAGANKMWAGTPADNARTIRFMRGIGMRSEAILRHHFGPKRHAVVCSMLRSEWLRSPWAVPTREAA